MLSLVSRTSTGLKSTLCQFNWTFAMASSDDLYSAKVSICIYFEHYHPNQIFSSSCKWSTVIRKKKPQKTKKETLNQRPFLLTGAKPMVFTLEKGGVEFVPTQHHAQRSLWPSETRLRQFTACAERTASLLRECHSCFPELRLQYLRKAGSHCLPQLAPGNMISFSNKSGKADRSIEMGVTTAHTSLVSPCGKGSDWQLFSADLSALPTFIADLCSWLLFLLCLWLNERCLLSASISCVLPRRETGDTRKKEPGSLDFLFFSIHEAYSTRYVLKVKSWKWPEG